MSSRVPLIAREVYVFIFLFLTPFMLLSPDPASAKRGALNIRPGPQPLVDDYLFSSNPLRRVIQTPTGQSRPVISSRVHQSAQPYITVRRYGGKFIAWYNRNDALPNDRGEAEETYIARATSSDGIHWSPSQRVAGILPGALGAGVAAYKGRLYMGYWDEGATEFGTQGPRIKRSTDGLLGRSWESVGGPLEIGAGDIVSLARYRARARWLFPHKKTYEQGERGYRGVDIAESNDLLNWRFDDPLLFGPQQARPGTLEFYSLDALLERGDGLLVGIVRVLRDDLAAETGGPAGGLGYSVLAWSRDGIHWQRDTEPFLDRNPRPGSWDRAMSWGSSQVQVGKQTWLYYGGYRTAHKTYTDRQLGLARFGRDRYVAQVATRRSLVKTKLLRMRGVRSLSFNAASTRNRRISVRVVARSGKSLPGFGWRKLPAINAIDIQSPFHRPLPAARAFSIQFRLEAGARIYALGFNRRAPR